MKKIVINVSQGAFDDLKALSLLHGASISALTRWAVCLYLTMMLAEPVENILQEDAER